MRLAAAIFLGVLVMIVLFRQPIAEAIGHTVCAQQKLNCTLKLSRLDLGGITLRDLKVRNPQAQNDALTAKRLKVDFNWTSPFSLRASAVDTEDLVVRLDLSGARPVLGDLDATVKRFSGKKSDKPAPMPRLDLRNVRIIGDTPLGPVEARGNVVAASATEFSIDLTSPTAQLSLPGARMQVNAAELHANSEGDEIKAQVKLDLAKFAAGDDAVISDLKIELSLDQAAGVLTGTGAASAREIALRDNRLNGAEASANVESTAIDLENLSLERFLPGIRRLDLSATAGPGSVFGVAWAGGEAKANLAPAPEGGSAGKAMFVATDIRLDQGTAESFEIDLNVVAGNGAQSQPSLGARGAMRLRGATLAGDERRTAADRLSAPLKASLPKFAGAAARVVDRAAQKFDATLPLDVSVSDGGYSISALNGIEIRAESGLVLAADRPGQDKVVTWTSGDAVDWGAAGVVRLSGGGAPSLTVNLDSSAGDGQYMAAKGSLNLADWRVGEDSLSVQATGLTFETVEGGGSASGEMSVQLTGGFAGGSWTRAKASGAVGAVWMGQQFAATSPRPLTVGWDEARYGDMQIGAALLRYTPSGKLMERVGDAVAGKGTLAGFEIPVTGGNFTASTKAGPTAVSWATEGQLRINFDMDPAEVAMQLQDRAIPIRLNDIKGRVELSEGWRVAGEFAGGTVKAAEAEISDLKGGFDLSGAGERLDGKLTEVTMHIVDPTPKEERRFEAADFEGAANLRNGVADFSGLFTMTGSGVQIASVSGQHSLKTGAGALTFAPTPLIFRPGSFQPRALSPLLVGPANVTGRVDIAGGASWSPDAPLKTTASLDFRNVGFALASAGVFEGVSGRIVVDDLIAMKSAPGQTLQLAKVTLGLPIEKGVVKFQLIGFDAIRLEGAEWPFVGGFIRVKPVDFSFAAESNRVIAQAVDWDLAALVERFDLDDVKVNGKVSGDFPVVFSTGSARVDKALLQASSEGGVIQYLGSTGDAAGQADQNARMLFDALKDFRYQVMKLELDGDLAERMVLKINLLGRNPAVLNGKAFDLNIAVDAPLVDLVTSFNRQLGDFIGLNGIPGAVQDGEPPAPNETRN